MPLPNYGLAPIIVEVMTDDPLIIPFEHFPIVIEPLVTNDPSNVLILLFSGQPSIMPAYLRGRLGQLFNLVAQNQWLCTQNDLGMMTFYCYQVCLYI
jgi:hypothetical protein